MPVNPKPISEWHQFIGQATIKNTLDYLFRAYQHNKVQSSSILLHGPSGCGKTTLAKIISKTLGKNLHTINGNLIQKPADVISLVNQIKEHDILFIDETHAVGKSAIETLYSIMSDNNVSIMLGSGYHAELLKLQVPSFSLIAATTALYRLPAPFINRFLFKFDFAPYSALDMQMIIKQWLVKQQYNWSDQIVAYLATICRLNPRTANKMLTQVSYSLASSNQAQSGVALSDIKKLTYQLGFYKYGATGLDLQYLQLFVQYKWKYASLELIASMLNYSKEYLVNYIESFLLQHHFLLKTSRGRAITSDGIQFWNDCLNQA